MKDREISVVVIAHLIEGYYDNDKLKISSYRNFIEESFKRTDLTVQLLNLKDRDEAISLAESLITEYTNKGEERSARIIRRAISEKKDNESVITLD